MKMNRVSAINHSFYYFDDTVIKTQIKQVHEKNKQNILIIRHRKGALAIHDEEESATILNKN